MKLVLLQCYEIFLNFFDHDQFMAATKFYHFTEKQLNGLKVKSVYERTYGTQIIEYYDGWEYHVDGIIFPMTRMKQMVIILYEPPIYIHLETKYGNLKLKSEQHVTSTEKKEHFKIESFWIEKSHPNYVNLAWIEGQNELHEKSISTAYHTSDMSYIGQLDFYFHSSDIFMYELDQDEVTIQFHKFNANNTTHELIAVSFLSDYFTMKRNITSNEITNVYYNDAPVDVHLLKTLYLSGECERAYILKLHWKKNNKFGSLGYRMCLKSNFD